MSSTDTLVHALLRPSTWPQADGEPQLLETHISWVILIGEYAYKIKKPLKLEFLDFSTLELRRHWCDEELRLNRRWAPELYLDVIAITGTPDRPVPGGTGTPIEYAVRMRRFPQSALLSNKLHEGELEAADMLELAEMIADRHAEAPVNREARFGGLAAVRKPMIENLLYLEAWLDKAELAKLDAWTRAELERNTSVIEDRRQAGFVRECHGDLHLRNLVELDDRIVAFDCIEFSDELRILDVISDLSFLAMDLVAAGRGDLAWILLNRYLEVSGDYAGMRLYALYFVYHCLIRAKVDAIRASERRHDADRQDDLESMHHYCEVARRWIEGATPALIVMHGYSGSGKTWVSSRLLERLGAVRLRSDVERKRMHGLAEDASTGSAPGEGLYGADTSARTYERLFTITGELLAAGHRVILDAAFLDADRRRHARALAGELGVPCVVVDVSAPHETVRRRLDARTADASEADRAVLDYQHDHADPLDTARDGPIVPFVNREGADVDALVESIAATTGHR